jgi:hypothetical protein
MTDQATRYPELTSEEKRSRRRFHGLHFANAILMVGMLIAVFIDRRYLYAILPLGIPILAVYLYSLVRMFRFKPPRWREITVTLLLIPGNFLPLIGIVAYLLFSLACFFHFGSRLPESTKEDASAG